MENIDKASEEYVEFKPEVVPVTAENVNNEFLYGTAIEKLNPTQSDSRRLKYCRIIGTAGTDFVTNDYAMKTGNLQITITRWGVYNIVFCADISTGGGTTYNCILYKNGSVVLGQTFAQIPNSISRWSIAGTSLSRLNKGDVLTISAPEIGSSINNTTGTYLQVIEM